MEKVKHFLEKHHAITAMDEFELITIEEGHTLFKTIVKESALNPYEKAHGGYLYTLCDSASGLTVCTFQKDSVTLQANINYIRPGNLDDELQVETRTIHHGSTTLINEVKITNQRNKLVANGTFTMYIVNSENK